MNRLRCLMSLLVALVLVSTLRPASAAVEGRVWLDTNENGLVDAGEQGVAGCLVSEGVQLVPTDATGHYRLEPSRAQAVIFIVNPAGTWPVGPWWKSIDGAKPSAPIGFALKERCQDEPLVFVQGTDLHLRREAVPLYRKYIAHLNSLSLPPQFVVHTGDLVVDTLARDAAAAEEFFQLYENETEAIRYALRDVIGNHEHVGTARKDIMERTSDYDKGMYQRRLGPLSYAFRYGPEHGCQKTMPGKGGNV